MADIAPKSGEYNEGKLWFHRKGTTVTLGLTSSAAEEIGEVEGVEFPDDGADFEKGEVIITVEGSNGTIEVPTPASGIVQEINESLKSEPHIVSEDPFEEGWLIKIEIQDSSDLKEYSV